MPEIDLPPGKYRWRRPLSLPLAWAFVALGLGMLGWLYWHRATLTPDNLFFGSVFVAFCVGLVAAEIGKNLP
jgi:hypothetical protein